MILYSDDHPFVLKSHRWGLGWTIHRSDQRKRVLHTSDKEFAKTAYEFFAEQYVLAPEKYKQVTPILSNTIVPVDFTPTLLVIQLRDYAEYILIESEEQLKEDLFNLIKQTYEGSHSPLRHWKIPERLEACMLTPEEIEGLPNDALRNKVCEDMEKATAELDTYEKHNLVIDKVIDVITNKKMDKVFSLFDNLHSIWYSSRELTSFYGK